MFEKILGNDPIKIYLQKATFENRLPQTLLFSGPSGVGKSLFAKELAVQLLGSQKLTDLHFLAPEGKSGLYAIDTIRKVIEKDREAPFESSQKVFILEDADRMMPASANALLKTLEEPSFDSIFILLTSKANEMLPTILSRCTLFKFNPLKNEEIEAFLQSQGLPTHFAKWAHGSIERALESSAFEEQSKILFKILSQKISYPEMMIELTKFDEKEDPLQRHALAEYLFVSILMWYRDQQLKSVKGKSKLLFFPDEPTQESASLQEMENAVAKARFAFARNMKLSHCLQMLLSEFSRPAEFGAQC